MLSTSTIPFLIHALIETPAAFTFIFRPSSQLQPLPPSAALILQSFGGLLLTSNLIALILIRRPFDDVARQASLAFSFWHLWPCYRAYMRMNGYAKEEEASTTKTLGGPVVHLGVHVVLLTMFLVSEQPESRLLNIDIHLVIALVLVQVHLATEQRAEEAVDSTLLPRASVLGSHEILKLLVNCETHLTALAGLAIHILATILSRFDGSLLLRLHLFPDLVRGHRYIQLTLALVAGTGWAKVVLKAADGVEELDGSLFRGLVGLRFGLRVGIDGIERVGSDESLLQSNSNIEESIVGLSLLANSQALVDIGSVLIVAITLILVIIFFTRAFFVVVLIRLVVRISFAVDKSVEAIVHLVAFRLGALKLCIIHFILILVNSSASFVRR
ncbi:hypothetical protein HG530_002561 [Fusarium avenaceum]|nr:hypothetical protein HG530_002561 [Fusarium avenaceum]